MKKNILKGILLLIIPFNLASCSNEYEQLDDSEILTVIKDPITLTPETLGKIQNLGFDTSKIAPELIDNGNAVVVEGDIKLTKEDLNNNLSQKQTHFRDRLVNCDYVNEITIDDSVLPRNGIHRKALQDAIKEFNAISGTTLRLSLGRLTEQDKIDRNDKFYRNIRVTTYRDDPNSWGRASLARGGKPLGFTINLNSRLPGGKRFSRRQWTRLMVHELGHVFGLMHIRDHDASNAVIIPGTPTELADQNKSIMKSDSNMFKSERAPIFSKGDKQAIRRIYSNKENALCRN